MIVTTIFPFQRDQIPVFIFFGLLTLLLLLSTVIITMFIMFVIFCHCYNTLG